MIEASLDRSSMATVTMAMHQDLYMCLASVLVVECGKEYVVASEFMKYAHAHEKYGYVITPFQRSERIESAL